MWNWLRQVTRREKKQTLLPANWSPYITGPLLSPPPPPIVIVVNEENFKRMATDLILRERLRLALEAHGSRVSGGEEVVVQLVDTPPPGWSESMIRGVDPLRGEMWFMGVVIPKSQSGTPIYRVVINLRKEIEVQPWSGPAVDLLSLITALGGAQNTQSLQPTQSWQALFGQPPNGSR